MTTYPSLESTHFPTRMRAAVSLAWALFSRKVGSELMHINKEASIKKHQCSCSLLTYYNKSCH
jgi:hypothetical protein